MITPDYRGAGQSSKPESGYTKSVMAADLEKLLSNLSITEPVHVVGHDIGGMIAYTFASRYPKKTASVVWGECPLPGTTAHHEDRTTHNVQQFHFIFHSVLDLPEALVAGREEIYLNHFFSKLGYNAAGIGQEDLDHYVKMYRQPGAMRCGFNVYRAFLKDGEENLDWISKHGKCKVRALALGGAQSRHTADVAKGMMEEVHEEGTYRVAEVPASGHWIAEENPDGFSQAVLDFVQAA